MAVWVSSRVSLSSSTETVMVWGVLQLEGVKEKIWLKARSGPLVAQANTETNDDGRELSTMV